MKKSILSVFAIASLLFSCSSSDDGNIEETPVTPEVPVTETATVLLTADTTFGNILTDVNGMSLYYFSKDTKEVSECSDGCKAAWPIFYTESLIVSEGLNTSDFGTITRADGDKQTTYKGWPLYYFASDTEKGDVNGDKVGDNWYVAKPDYSLMYAQAKIGGSDDLTFYMTNAAGRTIYLFANDTKGKNNFTAQDFSNDGAWPIITLELDKLPSILDKNDFDTIDVFGKNQVTYKGWPLYYFGSDTNRGDAKGVSGVWPIVNVDTEPAADAEVVAAVVAQEQEEEKDTEDMYTY